MSRILTTLLIAFGFAAAGAVSAAAPDASVPRKVGGGLRQMLVASEHNGPKLKLELKTHITNRRGDPLVFLQLANGVTAEQALPQLRPRGFSCNG